MHTSRAWAPLAVGLTLALAGCSRSSDPAPSSKSSATAPTAAAPTASAAQATPSAAPSASAAASAPEAGAGEVDLLYATPAVVAVSSRVDNPRDLPEHLVDGRAETAWNGRSGDLVGGFIAFSVPEDAHVTEVLLSAGFDKKTEKEDLFEANVRVTKVRLSRAGKVLREVALDPSVRTPQRIEVGTAGGAFKLEVLAVKAGTKPSWRELAISELSVRGVPGKTRRKKPMAPRVKVGGLDAATPQAKTFPTLEEACARLVADAKAALDEDKKSPWHGSRDPGEPSCARGATKLTVAGPGPASVEVLPLDVSLPLPGPYDAAYAGDLLAFRTAKGVVRTDMRLHGSETASFTKVETQIESLTWSGPTKLVIRVREHTVTDSDGYFEPGHEAEAHTESNKTRVVDCTFGDAVECH